MTQFVRILFAALFLLLGGGTGVWAQDTGEGRPVKKEDGTVVILPPDIGAVILPELSTETAKLVSQITLQVQLLDGADKPAYEKVSAVWTKGVWKNTRGEVVSRLPVLLKALKFQNDQLQGRYRLQYRIVFPLPHAPSSVDVTNYLPLSSGKSFWVPAAFPYELATIDAGKLEWAADPAAGGLTRVICQFKHNVGGSVKTEAVALSSKEPQAKLLVGKEGAVLADITFNCSANSRNTAVKWGDSGKDLRALPSGLNIVLSRPVCK